MVFSTSFVNVGSRIASSSENLLIFGGDVDESMSSLQTSINYIAF